MSTRETIEGYFDSLKQGKQWESFFDEEVVFTSFTSPMKRIAGKSSFIEATKRFYSTVRVVELRDLLIDGEKACALTHYELQPPGGKSISSDVSEIFTVRNNKIVSFDIYFDSAPFPK